MSNLYKKELDIINNIYGAILYCKYDEFSTILYANQYFYDLIGYTKEEMETKFNNRFADLVIDDVSEILIKIEDKISKGENLDYEYRLRRKDNSIIWVHDTAVYNKEDNAFYVTLMDITYMKSVEYQKKRFNNYLNNITNKIIITDIDGIIEYKNNEAKNNYFYPEIGGNINEYIFSNIIGYYEDDLWEKVKSGSKVEYETRVKIDNKFVSHNKNQLIPIKDELGEVLNIMQISENIMNKGDTLTQFPTRYLFEEYYEKVKLHIEDNLHIYMVLLDIDNFKKINDAYGHIIGDKVILETATKISDIIYKRDYVCRYGGDEFILLLIDENDDNIIDRLIKISEYPAISKELVEIDVTYSIGVAKLENKELNYFNLLDLADKALYNVKRNGRNNICFASDFKLVK